MDFRKRILARVKLNKQAEEERPQAIIGDTFSPITHDELKQSVQKMVDAPVAPAVVVPTADYSKLSISEIARLISKDWKNVYFGAKPYLKAMFDLESIRDNYGMDSGTSVVLYFLANASGWRGPVAKAIKAELNKRAKSVR